ncbi:MAG: extracellular solute-binding protein [Chelatococcus sp.]|jgi:raffinose/stachyose/melibiose transport system substrate-binding protein|uniref:ABC transporter substrate-binding protein n=1 Tax=unclassified Chelatococcus TaxID=2638111 RepID=UPI001BCB3E34|nr:MULTISPECIES: extracellular solute-binding protein [unclassified Chelatococcus]CAH1658696.1 conserved hypothetical protein [Hyphomicrobiales bacterium]MBS7742136.1 extracellular solute-binding protein [Chelatococcus sp. HY11]MBX3538496.1 extracellular solute-binding protein [Chelatococcus sp.]MBX3542746.1 extracellular solute-binding protein [Chelatococcus sp.]MCO5075038.1 extracellular solute-binding protein [Chelatococcus sp.]
MPRKNDEGHIHSRRTILKLAAALSLSPLAVQKAFALDGQLRVYANSSLRAGVQAVAKAFVAKNSGVNVRTEFANTDQIQTTTRVQLGAGTAPDVITVWPGSGNPLSVGQIAPAGYLMDLTSQNFGAAVPELLQESFFVNGKSYFLPTTVSLIGTYANLKVVKELGLEQPTTWSEFLAFCQKVKDAGKIPLALGNGSPWVTQLVTYALVATTGFARNPTLAEDMRAGKLTFANSDGWREALEKYMELNKRGFFNPNPNGTSYDEALQMVGSGEAAMSILTSPSTKGILNFAGHRDFIIWPTPATDNPQETRVPSSLGNSLGINAKTRNPEAALAFLKFMGSPEMLSLMGSELDLPVLGKDVTYDPIFTDVMQMVNSGKIAMFMDNKWPNARVQQTHFSGIQELFAGSATIADVLKRMDQAYQSG